MIKLGQLSQGFLHFWMRNKAIWTGIFSNIYWLYLSVDIHQGDKRFSVHSRGKQCAFMSLSALLTARNVPPKLVVENNI